jgi:hypothetical protein
MEAQTAEAVRAEPPPHRSRGLRCREIADADVEAIIGLLCEGFRRRDRLYWTGALRGLSVREPPPGLPRYGYMLECAGEAVGALLLISAAVTSGDRDVVRSNLSSWYVRPEFRVYASMLVSRVLKLPSETFVNVSPAVSTWPTIEAQGFHRFNSDAFAAFPALSRPVRGVRARLIGEAGADELGISAAELRLLREHEAHGCISLCVSSPEGGHPFVFRRRVLERFPLASGQLIYCRRPGDVSRFASALGRALLRAGIFWILMATDAAVAGVVGWRFAGRLPMYFAGPVRPRAADFAYTEVALFGI